MTALKLFVFLFWLPQSEFLATISNTFFSITGKQLDFMDEEDSVKPTDKRRYTMSKGFRPLTIEELTEAGDTFFPRFNNILERMPEGSTIEDTLKVMEKVLKLGHHQRREKEKLREFRFGIKRAIGFFQPEDKESEET